MISGKQLVQSLDGIHARPAALIASCVLKCSSDVTLRFKGEDVDPGKYLKLMSLGIKCGDEVELIVDGSDEKEVFAEIMNILQTE